MLQNLAPLVEAFAAGMFLLAFAFKVSASDEAVEKKRKVLAVVNTIASLIWLISTIIGSLQD